MPFTVCTRVNASPINRVKRDPRKRPLSFTTDARKTNEIRRNTKIAPVAVIQLLRLKTERTNSLRKIVPRTIITGTRLIINSLDEFRDYFAYYDYRRDVY